MILLLYLLSLTADLRWVEVDVSLWKDGRADFVYKVRYNVISGSMHGFYLMGLSVEPFFDYENSYALDEYNNKYPIDIKDLGGGKYDIVLGNGKRYGPGQITYIIHFGGDLGRSGNLAVTQSEFGELVVFHWAPPQWDEPIEHYTVNVNYPIKVRGKQVNPDEYGFRTEKFMNERYLLDYFGQEYKGEYYFTVRIHKANVSAMEKLEIQQYIPSNYFNAEKFGRIEIRPTDTEGITGIIGWQELLLILLLITPIIIVIVIIKAVKKKKKTKVEKKQRMSFKIPARIKFAGLFLIVLGILTFNHPTIERMMNLFNIYRPSVFYFPLNAIQSILFISSILSGIFILKLHNWARITAIILGILIPFVSASAIMYLITIPIESVMAPEKEAIFLYVPVLVLGILFLYIIFSTKTTEIFKKAREFRERMKFESTKIHPVTATIKFDSEKRKSSFTLIPVILPIFPKTAVAGELTGVILGDRYKIDVYIGAGGMSSVYKAIDIKFDREVVIKILHPELTRSEAMRERFYRQAKMQAKLGRHQNISLIYDYFDSDGTYYIVEEYIDGSSLSEVLHKTKIISYDKAVPLFMQVLSGLSHAHNNGIIHRDIKPSNIMLTRDGWAKITDFGIGKMLGDVRLTRTGTVIGTPEYMSPEQIRGSKDIDHRTDIYSAGITLYEMVTGRPPFVLPRDAESDFEVRQAHVNNEPPDPREFNRIIPEWLVRVIMKALMKEPEQRYQTCDEFASALSCG